MTLEKLQCRWEAIELLEKIKNTFCNEVRVYNNLGIIYKRDDDLSSAMKNYKAAIQVDPKSFFPNYNLAVMLAPDPANREMALKYFTPALKQAQKAGENLYEMNVLLSMAML